MQSQTLARGVQPIPPTDIDLDCSQQLLTAFMDSLQRHFKKDTCYNRPLISPQVNTLFALDSEVAANMAEYMAMKLTMCCGFREDEFRITHRQGTEEERLQRLRLDFSDGITFETIRRISNALTVLEKAS